jgi:tRNA-splicing ligase RtcB
MPAGVGKLVAVDRDANRWNLIGDTPTPVTPQFFANQAIVKSLEDELLLQVLQTAQIPHLSHLGYTADAHLGRGTAIGTTMVANLDEEPMISASTVGVDIGCGLSVQLTPLSTYDLQDQSTIRSWMKLVEKAVRPGEGRKSPYKLNGDELWAAAVAGPASVRGSLARLLTAPEEGMHIEDSHLHAVAAASASGITLKDAKEHISKRAWQRTHTTVGTLGGGNHFLELQVIRVMPGMNDLASTWGLRDGQVVVMLHSGSRGGGHQIAQEYEKMMLAEMKARSLPRPNPEIAYVPLHTPLGAAYMLAQAFALNVSRLNRMLMRKAIRQAFNTVYGINESEIELLYDIAHNFCACEEHHGQQYLVHRKGATKALPADHPGNSPIFRTTGHPVIIPGSMGARSRSYILVGQPSGAVNYYTVNHGAGRTMSRRQARQRIGVEEFEASLTYTKEELSELPFSLPVSQVMLNKRDLREVIDEAPSAYKASKEIIDSVVGAGLANVVAECLPVACIKG